MDRWIELSRAYRHLLCTVATFEDALVKLRSVGGVEFQHLLDEGTDWARIAAVDLSADRKKVLEWYDDIRACDLGQGVDIIHVELGNAPEVFEISAWRWADRIMLIDDGLIEPDSIRTISSPGRAHPARELPSRLFSGFPRSPLCGEFAAYAVWLLFCSYVPLEAYGDADLKSKWGIERELGVVYCFRDAILHGGFVTSGGWKRPTKVVEVPHH